MCQRRAASCRIVEELKALCVEFLSEWQWPTKYQRVDSLPKTANNKLRRMQLLNIPAA